MRYRRNVTFFVRSYDDYRMLCSNSLFRKASNCDIIESKCCQVSYHNLFGRKRHGEITLVVAVVTIDHVSQWNALPQVIINRTPRHGQGTSVECGDRKVVGVNIRN